MAGEIRLDGRLVPSRSASASVRVVSQSPFPVSYFLLLPPCPHLLPSLPSPDLSSLLVKSVLFLLISNTKIVPDAWFPEFKALFPVQSHRPQQLGRRDGTPPGPKRLFLTVLQTGSLTSGGQHRPPLCPHVGWRGEEPTGDSPSKGARVTRTRPHDPVWPNHLPKAAILTFSRSGSGLPHTSLGAWTDVQSTAVMLKTFFPNMF